MNGQMGGPRNSAGALFNSPMPDRFGMNNGISNGGLRGGGLVGGGGGPGQGGPFMGGAGGPGGASLQAMGQPQPGIPQQGAVLMVYGLNKDKMNADRIFNLLCLYGNVVRIKFLKTKEGCAMVQMGDALAVERAVANLNNTTFFSCKMQLGYSKQAFLADVQQPYDLPDGTPSFKDYMGNKNNRFINPEMASKNRIQPPSKILHFFNTPPGLDEDQLKQVFIDGGVTEPKSIKLFPSKTERSSSGLLEFNNISEALEGLQVPLHHEAVFLILKTYPQQDGRVKSSQYDGSSSSGGDLSYPGHFSCFIAALVTCRVHQGCWQPGREDWGHVNILFH
ncbi:Heterogeneous nuclear ribonucleoprotein L [Penaeus vannamei]|uniref:Heterogeneous nuclear ribonucleoprotein L n=1 Tax=Penaeus vannamei TaxID=6689 RepID=A0A3R7PFQ9_PENVA|nr:Heterogeneous nuclear ribonucleoprotein L [Penaeus vannamei]